VRVRAYLWGEEGAVVSTCMHPTGIGMGSPRTCGERRAPW
jgi:hypothetical protein